MSETIEKPAGKDTTDAPAKEKIPSGKWAFWQECLAVVLVGIAVDQLVKLWAQRVLMPSIDSPGRVITVIPGFFDFTYAENQGAAFSIADGHVGPLAIVSVVSTIVFTVFWWFLPARERLGRLAIALIVSGAIGNLIDRAFRGYVVDMFHAFWREWHYPIFNVADVFICVGAAMLGFLLWKGRI